MERGTAPGGLFMATSLDLFAYLAAFVTVILALAVSDWLQSFHRLLLLVNSAMINRSLDVAPAG